MAFQSGYAYLSVFYAIFDSMNNDYLQKITNNLTNKGFALQQNVEFNEASFDIVGHKAKLELTKFGLNDYFFIVKHLNDITIEGLNAFSELGFKYSGKHRKNFLPPGIFGGYWVFPIVISDVVPEEVFQSVEITRPPKHWSSAVFPVLINSQVNKVHYYQGKVAWGAAYQAGFKQLVNEVTT